MIEGVATTGLALIFALILPNSSKKILGLSSTECDWVQWNFSSDQGQVDDPHEVSAYRGLIMAIKDVKTWLLLGILYCVSPPSPLPFLHTNSVP